MASSELHELVNPLLTKICHFYVFKKSGVEVKYDDFLSEIRTQFSIIRKKIERNELLKKEYLQIEKPLVFFIDYFIEDTNFSFSREYEPMARMYNELSGDDKFFDLLEECLEDPSADKTVLEMFYLMLGLGFDGALKREPKEVISKMFLCSEKLGQYVNPKEEYICPDLQPELKTQEVSETSTSKIEFIKRNIVVTLACIALFCFLLNLITIFKNTSDFTDIVEQTMSDASPYKNLIQNTKENINDE
ncbi:MAG: DotU family type IV/VI secretion system protein [Succinivibrio sp.]|nr:DotU family type IV/VI secretion system protein [Succinivibrio sp.]